MQNSVVEDLPRRRPGRHGFNATELEKRGIQRSFGAPVTGAVSVSDGIAVCFGLGVLISILGTDFIQKRRGCLFCF